MAGPEFVRVGKDERRWVLGFSVFSLLITLIPYLLAFARQGPDWVFSGFLFGVDDGNSYIAKMLGGAAGAWVFKTSYSSLPQNGLPLVFLPYLVLGKLAAAPEQHLQLVALFHLFRFAAGLLLISAVYDFIALFEVRRQFRRIGVVLVTFGGGLGWLLAALGRTDWLGSLPLDFYSPETFGFLALFGLPHLVMGRALMLMGLNCALRPAAARGLAPGALAGGLWLIAGLFNPLSPAIAWIAMGSFLLYRIVWGRRRDADGLPAALRTAATAVLVSAPLVVYFAAASVIDPFFRAWTEQNTITSPHPLHYLAAYGIFLPYAYRGARRALADSAALPALPLVWVSLLPVLAYAPTNLQRRMVEGLFVALVILVLRGLGREADARPGARSLPLLLAFPSTLILLAGSLSAAWTPGRPVFRPAAEVAAFEFLASRAPTGAVVLAPMDSANPLPAFAPLRVVLGHGPETVGFAGIRPRVEAFFAGQLPGAEALAFLNEQGVDYVLLPPGTGISLEDMNPSLVQIYNQAGYAIFALAR